MNRLAPPIARSPLPSGPGRAWALDRPVAAAPDAADPAWLGDLKLFATGWAGGLVFFGTLLA